jgi:SHS family lactate transporter-like MFS transporter
LSPPEFRAFVVGVSYQLGNLASSASSTIETTIGEQFPLYNPDGSIRDGTFNYGKVTLTLHSKFRKKSSGSLLNKA